MNTLLTVIQIILSILLIIAILLQAKGTGLGSEWGGSGKFYHTKRGMERVLFGFTIFIASVYFITSIVNFVLF